jgi:hypothetical protein
MKPARVFFLCPTQMNTAPAQQYGEIIHLFDSNPNAILSQKLIDSIRERLAELDFNPERDFIPLTGPAIPLALFLLVVGSITPEIQVLIYESRLQGYIRHFLVNP